MCVVTLVVNGIVSCLDTKKQCDAFFIDLSKAFNIVDHSLLIQMCNIGFDATA